MANVDKFALMVNITEAAARFFDLCPPGTPQISQLPGIQFSAQNRTRLGYQSLSLAFA